MKKQPSDGLGLKMRGNKGQDESPVAMSGNIVPPVTGCRGLMGFRGDVENIFKDFSSV